MEVILDGELMTDRPTVHDLLSEKLAFPEYYGRNLDALYDCLTDLRNIHLILENWQALPDWRAAFKAVFEDAENDGRGLIVTFA